MVRRGAVLLALTLISLQCSLYYAYSPDILREAGISVDGEDKVRENEKLKGACRPKDEIRRSFVDKGDVDAGGKCEALPRVRFGVYDRSRPPKSCVNETIRPAFERVLNSQYGLRSKLFPRGVKMVQLLGRLRESGFQVGALHRSNRVLIVEPDEDLYKSLGEDGLAREVELQVSTINKDPVTLSRKAAKQALQSTIDGCANVIYDAGVYRDAALRLREGEERLVQYGRLIQSLACDNAILVILIDECEVGLDLVSSYHQDAILEHFGAGGVSFGTVPKPGIVGGATELLAIEQLWNHTHPNASVGAPVHYGWFAMVSIRGPKVTSPGWSKRTLTRPVRSMLQRIPSTKSWVPEFQASGFATVRGVLKPKHTKEIVNRVNSLMEHLQWNSDRSNLLEALDKDPSERKPFLKVYNLHQTSKDIMELATSPRIAGIAAAALGTREVRLLQDHVVFKEKGDEGSGWEQDGTFTAIDSTKMVIVSLALSPVTPRMGPVLAATSSHVKGLRGRARRITSQHIPPTRRVEHTHKMEHFDDGDVVELFGTSTSGALKAGDVTVRHAWTLTKDPPNKGSHTAKTISFTFYADGAFVHEKIVQYLGDEGKPSDIDSRGVFVPGDEGNRIVAIGRRDYKAWIRPLLDGDLVPGDELSEDSAPLISLDDEEDEEDE